MNVIKFEDVQRKAFEKLRLRNNQEFMEQYEKKESLMSMIHALQFIKRKNISDDYTISLNIIKKGTGAVMPGSHII